MAERTVQDTLDALEPLVGRWRMVMGADPDVDGRAAFTAFERMPGRRFLGENLIDPSPGRR
jgi:hypothetical protein